MATTSTKEIITIKQKPFIIINDSRIIDLLEDENYLKLLNFLKKGSMSVEDLEKSFENIDEKKSNKSIYRYLNKLIENKLVTKAGKRICSKSEHDLTTETIYMRTAIVFIKSSIFIGKKYNENSKDQIWDAIHSLLVDQLGENISQNDFTNLLNEIDTKKQNLAIRLLESANELTLEKIAQLDFASIEYGLYFLDWLLLNTKYNVKKEFEKLLKD